MAEVYDMSSYGSDKAEEPSDDGERGREWMKKLKDARDKLADWRTEARDDFAFVAGDQWSQEDKALLEEQGRPAIVFNRLVRTVNAVAGLEIQNRQEVRYLPREMGDVKVNEMLTAGADWIRDNCDAEDEESDAFREMTVCGMGWTETLMDYEVQADGKCLIERVDPLEMVWDPTARQKNLSDARWVARVSEMDIQDFRRMWPGVEPAAGGSFWLIDEDHDPHDATEAHQYDSGEIRKADKSETWVAHIQYWEREVVYRVLGEEGRSMEFSEERWKKVKPYVEEKGLRSVKTYRRVYKRMFMNGTEILEEPPPPVDDGFSFNCMTAHRDRNRNYWFGLVAVARDPQRWANKWLSQILHTLNSNSKGGLLIEETATDDSQDLEDRWAQADSVIWLKDGGLQKVQEKGISQYPEGMDRMLNYAMEAIDDVIGVSAEFLGLAGNAQAGILEMQRREAGVSLLAPLFDALRQYRKRSGRVLAYFVQNYLSDGRLVRIMGDEGAKYVPLLMDPNLMEYDVVVDDAPTSTNMKNRTFAVLSELLPMAIQAGVPVPPQILDYAPLPESLITEWKKMIASTGQDPATQQAQKLQQELMQAEIQNKLADAQYKGAKAQEAQDSAMFKAIEGQQEAARAQQEQWMAGLDALMKRQEYQADEARQEREAVLAAIKSSTEAMSGQLGLQKQQYETEQARIKVMAEAAKTEQDREKRDAEYRDMITETRNELEKSIREVQASMPGSTEKVDLGPLLKRLDSLGPPPPQDNSGIADLAGAIQGAMGDIMQGLNELSTTVANIQGEITRPKQIERNEYGEAVAVNGRAIQRDSNGNIVTIQ